MERNQMIETISAFIMLLMSLAPNAEVVKSAELRNDLATHIIGASVDYDIDPYYLTWNIYRESSFRVGVVADSPRKEFGLCQVHGVARRMCVKGFKLDLSNAEGQIRCMAALLEHGKLLCGGSEKRGLYWYRSGKCRGKVETVYRIRMRGFKKAMTELKVKQ
jgi:hypothetical protein